MPSINDNTNMMQNLLNCPFEIKGDAAAAKLYGVLMLQGNFAEAANVTIPQYVRVFGVGEGVELVEEEDDLAISLV